MGWGRDQHIGIKKCSLLGLSSRLYYIIIYYISRYLTYYLRVDQRGRPRTLQAESSVIANRKIIIDLMNARRHFFKFFFHYVVQGLTVIVCM